MRVAMYYNNRDVRQEERPVPRIGPDELLVKVMASGICGTDVMEWYRVKKAPLVLGHEIAGKIVEVGDRVQGFLPGNRVFVSHHVPCNQCRYCLSGHTSVCDILRSTNFDPGGFAEYIRVPKVNVQLGTFVLPEELSFEEGSFIEPVACTVRGQKLARLTPGQSVLVMGSGISGLLHLQGARARGADRVIVTDISPYRLKMARDLGADEAISATENVPKRLREANHGRLADLVILCTGAPAAIEQAMESVDRGGTILFFAPTAAGIDVSIPLYELWRNEVTLMTSYAGSPEDIIEAIQLIRDHYLRVREMITHRLTLAEAGLGFELVTRAEESMKVILEPQRP